MKGRSRFLTALATCAVAGCGSDVRTADTTRIAAPGVATSPVHVPDTSDWRVSVRGIGPLEAGMSPARAYEVLHLVPPPPADTAWTSCDYVALGSLPAGVRVMVEDGRIARIDVRDTVVSTQEGARVGDSEARIRQLYADRLEIQPHKYTDGHYLVVRSPVPADSSFRLVFETDGKRVLEYRAGRLPPVQYVERCG